MVLQYHGGGCINRNTVCNTGEETFLVHSTRVDWSTFPVLDITEVNRSKESDKKDDQDLENPSYVTRFKELGLLTLEKRNLREMQ